MTATDPPSTPASIPDPPRPGATEVLAEIDRLHHAYTVRPIPSGHRDLAAWWARGAQIHDQMESCWTRALDIDPTDVGDRLLLRALLAAAHGAAAQASSDRLEAWKETLRADAAEAR